MLSARAFGDPQIFVTVVESQKAKLLA